MTQEFILTVAYKVFPNGKLRHSAVLTFDDMGEALHAYEHWVNQQTTTDAKLTGAQDGYIYRRLKR